MAPDDLHHVMGRITFPMSYHKIDRQSSSLNDGLCDGSCWPTQNIDGSPWSWHTAPIVVYIHQILITHWVQLVALAVGNLRIVSLAPFKNPVWYLSSSLTWSYTSHLNMNWCYASSSPSKQLRAGHRVIWFNLSAALYYRAPQLVTSTPEVV